MLIQCTKKLLEELKIEPVLVNTSEPALFSWHANLITVNRKKTVVFVNDSNHYVMVLYGIKARNFKNLDELITLSIRETLLAECMKPELVENFIQHSPVVTYAKTKDRSSVAKMNKACEMVYWHADELQSNMVIQSSVNRRVSTHLVGVGKGAYKHPNECLYKDLENFTGTSIFDCRAVELMITLELTDYKVWRKVVVPLHFTFLQLHHILQILFTWQDCHLHDFNVIDKDKAITNIVCGEDVFEYPKDIPMIKEADCKLSEYIPKYLTIQYTYDFGDDWRHWIKVGNVIETYPQNYPVCVDGEGNAPPEDVGGEPGYYDFLEIIADPKHPDHKEMINWSQMQGYQDFNIELINHKLKGYGNL